MIEFKFRVDQLGSQASMGWKDTETGERGVVFRFPAEWYDEVLRTMQENQEAVHEGYKAYCNWFLDTIDDA